MKPRAERGIMPSLGAGSRTARGGERRALIRAVAQEQRSQLLPVGRVSSCPVPLVFLWLAVQDFSIPINISNAMLLFQIRLEGGFLRKISCFQEK